MAALAFARPQLPAPSAYLAAEEKFNQLCLHLQAPKAQLMTHSELEKMIEHEGRELLRLLLQGHLDERAPGQVVAAVVNADRDVLTHQRRHQRALESIFGTVTVTLSPDVVKSTAMDFWSTSVTCVDALGRISRADLRDDACRVPNVAFPPRSTVFGRPDSVGRPFRYRYGGV